MNKTAQLLGRLRRWPGGLWLFSRLICFKAPYFATIRPRFVRLEPGFGQARFAKRRAVQNHLGTVHAIAMANLCELVAGTTLEITLPNSHRWIPRSMKIDYLAKATSDVTATCAIPPTDWPDAGAVRVAVELLDTAQRAVVRAEIEMYVSRRRG